MARRGKAAKVAAQTLGVTVQSVGVHDPNELESAFVAMTKQRPDALLIVLDPFVYVQRRPILEFAAKSQLPAMYEMREFVDEGGLWSSPTSSSWSSTSRPLRPSA